MLTLTRIFRRKRSDEVVWQAAPDEGGLELSPVEIAPNDPVVGFFQSASGAVDLDGIDIDSPAVRALRDAGVKLVVPLISQGELIGLLNLGPRRSERDYSGDDRKLLENLAGQAAPAVRVAQLVRQQEAEVRTRERLEQELHVAQLIQQQFLPKELPRLSGWQVAAYYKPARAVGGDFYDFIDLPDGKVGIVVGDVTDKGVPAALVMATTHSILRADGPRLVAPGEVLERANELLVPDIPAHMFVTCLYMVLDPASGRITYANAGHNLPYVRTRDGVVEMRATGMPLGLMPGMKYEEKEATLLPGQALLLHSDGLAEAHDPNNEMFGFPRLQRSMQQADSGSKMIDRLLTELARHTGAEWEQEDDITLVSIERTSDVAGVGAALSEGFTGAHDDGEAPVGDGERVLADFEVASEMGNERAAMERVVDAIRGLEIDSARLDKLKTAVAEATMNAIEHGNRNDPDVPVNIRVVLSGDDLDLYVTDRGAGEAIPAIERPDLEAKLAGEQTPRGWGLFLIKNMVDEMDISSNESHHTVKLTVHLKGNRS